MDVTQLLEPVLTQGVRNTHFFNGRVLTAEDLRMEQDANREQHRQLARALGAGIVHGYEVSRGSDVDGVPALRILPGYAFNPDGDPLALGRTVDLLLVSRESAVLPPEAGLFAVCMAPDDPLELTNVGMYVLTVRPASAFSDERAPMTELGGQGIAGGCGSRWTVEGVRFAVTPLPLAPAGTTPTPLALDLAELATQVEQDIDLVSRGGAAATTEVTTRLARRLSRLRNGAAYLCFGADRITAQLAAPLPGAGAIGFPDAAFGAVDAMRERDELGSCEVPLALFYLSRRGIEWVDAWAVRRPPVPTPTAGSLPVLPTARALADATAMMLQFQQQVRELTGSTTPTSELLLMTARSRFRFLPPAGLLPLRVGSSGRGFDRATFFDGIAYGAAMQVPGAKLRRLLTAGLLHPPVDLDAEHASVELWRVHENLAGAGGAPPAYVAFVTREAAGPVWADSAALTLDAAWRAWRGVIRRRHFLPAGTSADAVAAQVAIVNIVRDVMDVAARESALAAAGALDDRGALAAFERLADVQDDVQLLFRSSIPGTGAALDRKDFGASLEQMLATSLPSGGASLQDALDDADLAAAIRAQTAINQLVSSWSGGGDVATGPLLVDDFGSEGRVIVPGNTEGFRQFFKVHNGADGPLSVTLSATITGGSGDWSNAVSIEDMDGAPLTTVELAAAEDIQVAARVTAPEDAVLEEALQLTFRATVPAPNPRDVSSAVVLSVGHDAGEAQEGSVTITLDAASAPDLSRIPTDPATSIPLHLLYTGPDTLPTALQFLVTLTVDTTNRGAWIVDLSVPATTVAGTVTASVTLTRDQPFPLDVLVRPSAGAPRAEISLAAASTSAATATISGQLLQDLTLIVA